MQRIGAILSIIFCFVIIVIGYIHWNGKIEAATEGASAGKSETVNVDGDMQGVGVSPFEISLEELEELVSNLPNKVSAKFLKAYENEQLVKLLIVGSPALGSEVNGWSITVMEQLETLYGEDFLQIEIVEFDGTSSAFVESGLISEIASKHSDIILFEPYTLEDNGWVEIETSHQNIQHFIDYVSAQNPNVQFILQPPHPIYAARKYPLEVEALAALAAQEEIPYLDHWPAWPDPDSVEIQDYLDDTGMPNDKGHKVWAEAVIEYFGGK